MIYVKRTAEPEVLKRNKAAWLAALGRAQTKEERALALGKYRHHKIKDALVSMFAGKCAYCESKIRHIDYGDIEHYRPSSKYERRTFTWSNLLLSCGVCNGSEYKGDNFPLAQDGGPIVNPTADDPDDHLTFFYDKQAGLATVSYKTDRGKVTIQTLGLNRPDLREYRSEFVKKLSALSILAKTDQGARQLLDEAVYDSAEYAAFARHL